MSSRRLLVGLALIGAGGAAVAVAARRRAAQQDDVAELLPLTGGAPGFQVSTLRLAPAGGSAAHLVAPSWEPEIVTRLASWEPEPPSSPATRLLAGLWAAPLTAVGMIAAALSAAMPHRRDGAWLAVSDRGPVAWWLRMRGFAAVTFGQVVLARKRPTPALWAHELAHVRQAERLGIAMGPLYGGCHVLYGYSRNPLERGARRRAARAVSAPRSPLRP